MDKQLRQLIESEYTNMLGLVAYKHGRPVIEEYFGGSHSSASVHLFSITKSIVSLLTGIAEHKGLLSVSDRVESFFPGYERRRSQSQLDSLTVEHLLTMTAPFRFRCDPWKKTCTSPDWGLTALSFVGGKNACGEQFRYTTIGLQILSDILCRATGMSVRDFAEKELFAPLGIAPVANAEVTDRKSQREFSTATDLRGWVCDPTGHHTTGWGLSLTADDTAKIGQLILGKGVYGGRQILSEDYIRRMTAEHSPNYGYLCWIYPKGRPFRIMNKTLPAPSADIYCAQGVGGTMIAVVPEYDAVISMTCSMKYFPKPRFELIEGCLLPRLAKM